MSDIIQLLPDSVANQIAAGEVIQRPANVIKELVENAVDAGATDIKVLVADAGRTSIQVIDNGKGMSDTDARLAFERHATSKISCAKDLFALTTMGFRGEALASVAAVAQVTLKARQPSAELGTLLCIAGSKVTSQEPCACDAGSNFLVENLFYNVPARRKFLKGNSTELKNIITAFERIALVYPKISFSLFSNGTELLALKAGALRQRIVEVAGKRLNQFLLPVSVKTGFCTISGFVGKPESARKKNVAQYFFVNGRYMKHPFFNKAVATAFDRLVPEGEQVPYFIYFEVPADTIDVNIHPTKTEIKFENEQEIWSILTAAVRDTVGMFGDVATIDFDTQGRPDIPVFDPDDTISAPKVQYNPTYNPFNEKRPSAAANPFTAAAPVAVPSDGMGGAASDVVPSSDGIIGSSLGIIGSSLGEGGSLLGEGGSSLGEGGSSVQSGGGSLLVGSRMPSAGAGDGLLTSGLGAGRGTAVMEQQPEPDDPDVAAGDLFSSVGANAGTIAEKSPVHYQYKGRYIMTAVKSGLMIVDQHRAHMRVLYEQYLDRVKSRHGDSQKVLFPELLCLTPAEDVVLQKVADELTALGFELTPMGGNSYAVNAVPAGLDGVDVQRLLHDMIGSAGEGVTAVVDEIDRTLALTMARHAAIAYGCVLEGDEMESLVNSLFACSNFNYTPDGKCIVATIRQTDIDRMFG